MSSNRKRKIIGVAVISGVILVSVASVGAVKLVNEANATEVNKYVTAKNTNYNVASITTQRHITVHNYGGKNGTDMVDVCYDPGSGKDFFRIEGKEVYADYKFKIPSRVNSSFIGYFDQDGNQICNYTGAVQMDFASDYPYNKIANVTAIYAKYEKKQFKSTIYRIK